MLFRSGHEGRVTRASFSSDGRQVVTASLDGTARVWDVTGGESVVLEGHADGVTHASFSSDGRQVVTASWGDGTVRVWDIKGRQIAIFESTVAIRSPDGQRVAILQDGRVQVYDILPTLPKLLNWGCQWLDNYLKYGPATNADRAACNLPPRNDAQSDTVSSADTSAALAVSPFVSDMVHSAIVDPSFFTNAPQTDT